jgi:hypothetical protein
MNNSKAFSVLNVTVAANSISKGISKKDLQIIFKNMDNKSKGALSNGELISFWLKTR